MYGTKWSFLLMYGSHDMRHTSIPRVDGLSTRHPGIGASHQEYGRTPPSNYRSFNLAKKEKKIKEMTNQFL